jgi:methyl-accepting chemotaxis protein
MAFGLFRKRLPEPAAPAIDPEAVKPAVVADAPGAAETDSSR